ncbi:MAG: hypothetical protein FWF46_03865 [Oscillospiraceae bacterium]|nr:hypothetical protein [Oscillospiraceae bacterium]
MTNADSKQKSIDLSPAISDDSTLEDMLYRLYIQHKIDLSLNDFKNGDVISLEDLRKEVETW